MLHRSIDCTCWRIGEHQVGEIMDCPDFTLACWNLEVGERCPGGRRIEG